LRASIVVAARQKRFQMSGIAIVGGGISGLAAAYYLSRTGQPCTLIETSPLLGGVIRTERAGGCLIEAGPDSFLAQKPWALELIRELGLEDQVIGSNDAARRTFICRHGRLVPLPDGIQFLAPTRLWPVLTTPLFSWSTKARMGLEWFHRPRHERRDRSVADFVIEHYGKEVNEYLAQPMLAGVYGGAAEKLSAQSVLPQFIEIERKFGSLTRGMMRTRRAASAAAAPGNGRPRSLFLSLQGGMQQLTDALATRLDKRVRRVTGTVLALRGARGAFELQLDGDTVTADQVVLAVPAYRAGELLSGLDEALADLLLGVRYSSSITAALLYERAGWTHPLDGFGFLVPRAEGRPLAACTWVNTKFPSRVAEDRVLLRGFLAGEQAETMLSATDEELAGMMDRQCQELMGFQQTPAEWRIHRWYRAMAQYEVGHQRRLDELMARLTHFPGLHLAGNAYSGIGIPDCIHRSQLVAGQVARAV
jgi:protoporphyrinogen/coproporphyrinogen III oxidase